MTHPAADTKVAVYRDVLSQGQDFEQGGLATAIHACGGRSGRVRVRVSVVVRVMMRVRVVVRVMVMMRVMGRVMVMRVMVMGRVRVIMVSVRVRVVAIVIVIA